MNEHLTLVIPKRSLTRTQHNVSVTTLVIPKCSLTRTQNNVSVTTQQFYYTNCYFRATCFDSSWVIFRHSRVQIQG